MTRRLALGAVLLALMLLLGVLPSDVVEADHEDESASNLRAGLITRNFVLGEPIPVCSDDYPLATQAAIGWWNDHPEIGVDLFSWAGTGWAECPINDALPDRGVGGIVIYDWIEDNEDREPCRRATPLACVLIFADRLRDSQWHTWYGRFSFSVNPDQFGRDFDPATLVDDPATPVDESCSSAAAPDTEAGQCYRLVVVLAHELGHILSLFEWYKDHPNDPNLSMTKRFCFGKDKVSTFKSIMCCQYALDGVQDQDVSDFLAAYYPDEIKGVSAASTADPNKVRIHWSIENLHVEKGVQILWRPKWDGDDEACARDATKWTHAETVWAAASKANSPGGSGPAARARSAVCST